MTEGIYWLPVWLVLVFCLSYLVTMRWELDRQFAEPNSAITRRADEQHAAWLKWEATGDKAAYRRGLYGEYPPEQIDPIAEETLDDRWKRLNAVRRSALACCADTPAGRVAISISATNESVAAFSIGDLSIGDR